MYSLVCPKSFRAGIHNKQKPANLGCIYHSSPCLCLQYCLVPLSSTHHKTTALAVFVTAKAVEHIGLKSRLDGQNGQPTCLDGPSDRCMLASHCLSSAGHAKNLWASARGAAAVASAYTSLWLAEALPCATRAIALTGILGEGEGKSYKEREKLCTQYLYSLFNCSRFVSVL